MEIPYEKQFHFRDGTSVATLEQLKAKIESIGYEEFYHHVNAQKNDFAAWTRHVLHEEQLAQDLGKVTSIVETVEIINDFLHPRSVEVPRTDVQSKIEQSVYTTTLPEISEPLAIEQVPTTTPAPEQSGETTIVRFDQDISSRASEELFGKPSPAVQQSAQPPAQPSAQQPVRQPSEHESSHFVVGEFIYGLVTGLVVGLILGRLIS